MAEEPLKTYVLRRAGEDDGLTEDARLVVLAALGDPDDLIEVLGDSAPSAEVVEALTAQPATEGEPVGAYLKSISVQGFRGIGPKLTVPLPPGPGLLVIAGRNGSGKSTLAEALEFALTGVNSRWQDKASVWSQSWRNLHQGEPAEIRVGLTEQGSGPTTIGVDWPNGEDVKVDDYKAWVQRDGHKREDPSALGWSAALEMYRPLLSYDELGGILEGRPSDFYDQLYKLLGLEQLTEAMARLDAEVKRLKLPAADARKARDALKTLLPGHEDPRAAQVLTQVSKRKPDLDAVRPLITGGAAAVPSAWQLAVAVSAPAAQDVADACAELRAALAVERDVVRDSDALAVDRGRLLETGLEFHDRHGTQSCPVCGQGTLDEDWAQRARAALQQEQAAVRALGEARSAVRRARNVVRELVDAVAEPPGAGEELTTLAAAREAYTTFAAVPEDGDALADHVGHTLPAVSRAYAALRDEAATLIKSREDAWSPVAIEVGDWLRKSEAAAATDPKLAVATEAQKWLQDNAAQLRNERIAPLADQAREIWAALRQESNVNLGKIHLEGRNTSRRVRLTADVDGSDTDAFGVMSQGELQALALAIFIPRATSPASPFRFVVFDDPIQAMDPSKIDGFLEVLVRLAADRQVIVLTHDDRLPAAVRRSHAPARIVEVARAANSAVAVAESSRPANRVLTDAMAIAADDAVPDEIKKAAVPVLCREALEATAWDVFAAKAYAAGWSRDAVEQAWQDTKETRQRIALALYLEPKRDIRPWLDGGSARRNATWVAGTGVHAGVDDYRGAVRDTRLAVGDLAAMSS